MKISIYLRKELTNKEGIAPVCLRLSHRGKRVLISTGISVQPEKYNNGIVKNDTQTTARILSKLASAQKIITDLEIVGKLKQRTIEQVKAAIVAELSGQPANLFLPYFEKIMNKKKGATKEHYQSCMRKMTEYDKRLHTRTFEDVTTAYLNDFYNHCLKTARNNNNGAVARMRIIRAVFNAALDDEITLIDPFRKIRLKTTPTAKRNIGIDKLRELWHLEVNSTQKKYVDFWKLSFLTIGANTKDLCENAVIRNGRLEYNRAKTAKPYSVKLYPETIEIINAYRGKDRLLSFSEHLQDYRAFSAAINIALKKIGSKIGLENLTTYHARHTWASIAASLDIPKETIAAALGHSARTVTDIYIDFDQHKVDAANRKVIDYVLQITSK